MRVHAGCTRCCTHVRTRMRVRYDRGRRTRARKWAYVRRTLRFASRPHRSFRSLANVRVRPRFPRASRTRETSQKRVKSSISPRAPSTAFGRAASRNLHLIQLADLRMKQVAIAGAGPLQEANSPSMKPPTMMPPTMMPPTMMLPTMILPEKKLRAVFGGKWQKLSFFATRWTVSRSSQHVEPAPGFSDLRKRQDQFKLTLSSSSLASRKTQFFDRNQRRARVNRAHSR